MTYPRFTFLNLADMADRVTNLALGFGVCVVLCLFVVLGISWQAHYFVSLRVQISWQAQHFVNLRASPNLDGEGTPRNDGYETVSGHARLELKAKDEGLSPTEAKVGPEHDLSGKSLADLRAFIKLTRWRVEQLRAGARLWAYGYFEKYRFSAPGRMPHLSLTTYEPRLMTNCWR